MKNWTKWTKVLNRLRSFDTQKKIRDVVDVSKAVAQGKADASDQQFARGASAITKQTPQSILDLMQRPVMHKREVDVDRASLYYLKRLAHKEVRKDEVLEPFFIKYHKIWKFSKRWASTKEPRFVVLEQQVEFLRNMNFAIPCPLGIQDINGCFSIHNSKLRCRLSSLFMATKFSVTSVRFMIFTSRIWWEQVLLNTKHKATRLFSQEYQHLIFLLGSLSNLYSQGSKP